jgi:hypothetical protein
MPLDVVSTTVSFLIGVFTGAAGSYFGNRFTDRRREQEKSTADRRVFAAVRNQMPALIAEMKSDLELDNSQLVREFFVIERRSVAMGRSSKPRFAYYVEDHKQLHGQLEVLDNRGYIIDVTSGNTPVFRMTEEFVQLVKAST